MRARITSTLKTIFSNQVLNPFDTVRYEGDVYPDSRTLHTTWMKKIKDTYHVIRGGTYGFDTNSINSVIAGALKNRINPYDLNHIETSFELKTRPGLFDYATLGIFRLFHGLDTLCKKVIFYDTRFISTQKKIGIYIARAAIALPYMVINLIHHAGNDLLRPFVSRVLTLGLIPLILIAHGISEGVRKYKEHKIVNALQVQYITDQTMKEIPSPAPDEAPKAYRTDELKPSTTMKLNEALAKEKKSLKKVYIHAFELDKQNTQEIAFYKSFADYNKINDRKPMAFKIFDRNNPSDERLRKKLIEINKNIRRQESGLSTRPRHR